jgi:phenylacetate-CoA ligase
MVVAGGADRSRRRRRAVRWVIGYVLARVVTVVAFRSGNRTVIDAIRRFNRRLLNPVMLGLAGRRHWYAARLEHRGRRSGRRYATPVVARAVGDGFAVPLPYGTAVDWLRNVQAAGQAQLQVGGERYAVSDPRIVETSELASALSPVYRRASRLYGIRSWLVLAASPGTVSGERVDDGTRREPGTAPMSAVAVARDARRVSKGGPAAVAARQQERLDALVAHARGSSRFYAERYRDLPDGAVELCHLPVVTKPELMARFDEWVTDPAITRAGVEAFVGDLGNLGTDFLGRYVVFTTSGSTGVPALLVQDRQALAVTTGLAYVRSAGMITPRMVAGLLRRGARTAAVFAGGGHFLGTVMFERRLRTAPFRRRLTRFFSVLDPLPRLVEQLNDYQPAAIGSYASVIDLLADEQQAGRLRIDPLLITSGGELLSPAVRRRAEAAFGCPVVETYSASEAAPLSQPCGRGRLHVNADWFILEPIDEAGAPLPPGVLSHSVLVTNLANHVQPIIRYELGDSVCLGGGDPCPCGSPLPTIRVEGRTDEILHLRHADGSTVALLPMAVSTVVEETPGVHRFQILQTDDRTLTLRLDTDPGHREAVWEVVHRRLDTFLRDQGLPAVTVELSPELPQPDPHSGKLRHVRDARPSLRRTDPRATRRG